MSHFKTRNIFEFLVEYDLLDTGITLRRYVGDCLLKILYFMSSRYHRLFSRDSNLNSWQSFSLEVPLIAPVIASAEL